jgi:hypothetical protein
MALEGMYTNPGTGSFQPPGEPLYDGSQLTWVHENIDISDYADQNISIRFLLMSDSYITADGWYVDNIKISIYEATSTFQLTVNLVDGWNMVSIPGLHPVDQNVNTWWPYRDFSADVFRFEAGYQTVNFASLGEGYWMKHSGSRTYNTGDEWPSTGIQIVPNDPIPIVTGWNLISVYENPVAAANLTTSPSGLIAGHIYGYFSGYTAVDTLYPGYAYWLVSSGNGLLNIPTAMDKISAQKREYFKDDFGRITLTDASGKSYTLFSINDGYDLKKYELPPLPPSGVFDIRFSTGRIAENIIGSQQTIEMSGIIHPIRVRVENMSVLLQDLTGTMVNEFVGDGEEILIEDRQVMKFLVSGEYTPAEYSLEQNYPNPFNPSTMIEFSLPENVGNVRLSVYNSLGEKVAELVNSALNSGQYQYQWNAGNLASGVYIYELKTDKFNSIKKMLLIK